MAYRIRKTHVLLLAVCLGCLAVALSPSNAVGTSPLPAPISDSDYRPVSEERAKLGRLLFYDPILSGNKNISCGTCHHHDLASADGLSLSVGEGGVGLGPKRTVGSGASLVTRRVPRNAPALFNLGAREFTIFFHDGRVFEDPTDPTGFNTPAEDDLPPGLLNPLAAQALFPLLSDVEMLGDGEENDLARAFRYEREDVWPLITARIAAIEDYLPLFRDAYPEVQTADDITIVQIGNALADFMALEWRADQSPFDAYLRGKTNALSPPERRGLTLFYGEAGCATCHSGPFQTDHAFHAIAMPQIGRIRTRVWDPVVRDRGRINETDRLEDAYRFRTPSLRNIAETGPYGHSGAFATLEGVIRHHLDPVASFRAYDRSQVVLPHHPVESEHDFEPFENKAEVKHLLAANELDPLQLDDAAVADLVAFLKALTDNKSLSGVYGRPDTVPSGLPVD